MKKNAYKIRNVMVDSGAFAIFDPLSLGEFYVPMENNRWMTVIKLSKGSYKCYWKLLNSPSKLKEGLGILKVISGVVMIGDPSYVLSEKSSYFDGGILPKGCVMIDKTGGDGRFDLDFVLERLK